MPPAPRLVRLCIKLGSRIVSYRIKFMFEMISVRRRVEFTVSKLACRVAYNSGLMNENKYMYVVERDSRMMGDCGMQGCSRPIIREIQYHLVQ